MTTLHFPVKDDTDLNVSIFDEAMEALRKKFKVNREYHVPYLAGYNKAGTVLYIDSRMPIGYNSRKGKGAFHHTDQYLLLHESIEKVLLMFFGKQAVYQLCHQFALRLEQAAVLANGLDWKEYNDFMMYWCRVVEKAKHTYLPPDLDMTPYEDEDEPGVPKHKHITVTDGKERGA